MEIIFICMYICGCIYNMYVCSKCFCAVNLQLISKTFASVISPPYPQNLHLFFHSYYQPYTLLPSQQQPSTLGASHSFQWVNSRIKTCFLGNCYQLRIKKKKIKLPLSEIGFKFLKKTLEFKEFEALWNGTIEHWYTQ